MGLLIEPMDVLIDKRGSLGYAHEALNLVRSLGHLRLNDERAEAMVAQGAECIAAIHLCNCCVDPTDALYGDNHIRPGKPGVFDLDEFRRIVSETAAHFPESGRGVPLFIEYRNHGDADEHLAYLAESIERVLDYSTGW